MHLRGKHRALNYNLDAVVPETKADGQTLQSKSAAEKKRTSYFLVHFALIFIILGVKPSSTCKLAKLSTSKPRP